MPKSKKSRRQYTTEKRVAILREHLVDKVPVSEGLLHHPDFERSCEEIFGSVAHADEALSEITYYLAHDLADLVHVGGCRWIAVTEHVLSVVEDRKEGSLLLRHCLPRGVVSVSVLGSSRHDAQSAT